MAETRALYLSAFALGRGVPFTRARSAFGRCGQILWKLVSWFSLKGAHPIQCWHEAIQHQEISMTAIRKIEITNFRCIRKMTWLPSAGMNCLIGPGDSGKSTILDAIDLTLGARRQTTFTDADLHEMDPAKPIDIQITIGALGDELKDYDLYGLYHRGWSAERKELEDEPGPDLETVLTVRLQVPEDLEPAWSLVSERAAAQGAGRDLAWGHRAANAPTRLGAYMAQHFAWGQRSVLNRLSKDRAKASAALAAAGRLARDSFKGKADDEVKTTLGIVSEVGSAIGVDVGEVQALLDVQGLSFTGGTIGVHDEDGIPLRNLGLGSGRLLVAGMQRRAGGEGQVALIDEVEHGLEPYRITRLLHVLGSKQGDPAPQVFMTTHSPVVLRELSADQLWVVRRSGEADPSHAVLCPGSDAQPTLRACSDAFLARSVLVCEGKTEIGLVRGVDLHRQSAGTTGINAHGVLWADGNGDNTFARAMTFRALGYRVAILRDCDKAIAADVRKAATDQGIEIFEWSAGKATEDEVFACAPVAAIPLLLDIACEWRSEDAVDSNIKWASDNAYGMKECREGFKDEMRAVLGKAAQKKQHSLYKDIEPAERIGREVIGPNIDACGTLSDVIKKVFAWAEAGSDLPGEAKNGPAR